MDCKKVNLITPKLCCFYYLVSLDVTSSPKGTRAYTAPEMLESREFSKATDIFAYGVLMWEITTQEKPELRKDHWGQPINRFTHTFPDYVQKLLPLCWKKQPRDRLTIKQIIEQLPQGELSVNWSIVAPLCFKLINTD